ncbi:bile salt-activated lipase-like [Chanos chanos]|uniref:Carboxylic ester hydrolase n=1 Tax=Chanos chanos TaxID=29144 RepID=A0A6J2UYL2_CHACN|nr:bile salt-activated lipase-like [Chanos chanos]
MTVVVLGILIAAALFPGSISAATLGVVKTEGGMVEGTNLWKGSSRSIDVFKGIPFAAKPKRFEKPQRHPGWSGVLKTTQFKERCLQLNELQTGTRGSEDCLYLNIWVPQGSTVSRGLPVMVWIYGGGFMIGSAQGVPYLDNYLYNGEEIADRGNVIVVSSNYRLGPLGFLSTGDSQILGNYGLWDQHAAIAWVHRNIAAFGGDPNNITVFGESAGGASVNFQIISPKNKGLIRRAISQSGSVFCPWAMNTNPKALAVKVAQKVGCPTDAGMASCLKSVSSSSLILAAKVNMIGSASSPLVLGLDFAPVVDGDFLPDFPSKLFHNAGDIDYIAGTNDMDGHIFSVYDIPSVDLPLVAIFPSDVKTLLTSFTKEKGSAGATSAYNLYTEGWANYPTWDDIKRTIVDIETDYIFLVPAQTSLQLHARNSRTARTYSYKFSEPTLIATYPYWVTTDHAEDLQYVFGKPFSSPLTYFPQHRDVSGYLISYWTNFAKTGDPNKGGSTVPVTWPTYTTSGLKYLEINSRMSSSSVKQRLRTHYVQYWTTNYSRFP